MLGKFVKNIYKPHFHSMEGSIECKKIGSLFKLIFVYLILNTIFNIFKNHIYIIVFNECIMQLNNVLKPATQLNSYLSFDALKLVRSGNGFSENLFDSISAL
jgi:hypothetical protein